MSNKIDLDYVVPINCRQNFRVLNRMGQVLSWSKRGADSASPVPSPAPLQRGTKSSRVENVSDFTPTSSGSVFSKIKIIKKTP